MEMYKNIAYAVLAVLFIVIIFSCFNFQQRVVQNLSFREVTNLNSNKEGFTSNRNLKENKYKTDDNLLKMIENKLRGLTEELGGSEGKKEVKSLLTNTKKIVNLECAKCMMNMLDDNKGAKSINVESLIEDENNDNCVKCKKYTELSDTINSMINNL
jgi:ribosomal protein L44E